MKALSRVLFTFGFIGIFVAVGYIEGNASLLPGLIVGLLGSITSLSTMKYTGWFFE